MLCTLNIGVRRSEVPKGVEEKNGGSILSSSFYGGCVTHRFRQAKSCTESLNDNDSKTEKKKKQKNSRTSNILLD